MLKKTKFINSIQILLLTTLFLQFSSDSINRSTAHDVREIQTVELDVTPILREATWATRHIEILEDSTTVNFHSFSSLTTQDVLLGRFNFSSVNLEYDGLEAYITYLHQTLYIRPIFDPQMTEYLFRVQLSSSICVIKLTPI